MSTTKWRTYEEVAQYLLNQFAETFDLGSVKGKQIAPGKSGTQWEIDAKGLMVDGDGFVIVECRCYERSRINQESMGGLAYRIHDTEAEGGIIVTPLPLQKGATIIASHENIKHVVLDSNSTTSEYVMRFLDQIFVGVSDTLTISDSLHLQLFRDGKLVKEQHVKS